MHREFTIGDVIRKARKGRKWNQQRLGKEAGKYLLHPGQKKIDKTTVSKVETDPYTSEFGTVWRLAAAVGLTLAAIERRVESPFLSDITERQIREAEQAVIRRQPIRTK